MVRRVRVKFPDARNDWLIEIADETERKPLVVLPPGAGPIPVRDPKIKRRRLRRF